MCVVVHRTNTTLSGTNTIQASDAASTIQNCPPLGPTEPIPESGRLCDLGSFNCTSTSLATACEIDSKKFELVIWHMVIKIV